MIDGSRAMAPEENHPTIKPTLTLTQTLTLTGEQFSLGAIVRIPYIILPDYTNVIKVES